MDKIVKCFTYSVCVCLLLKFVHGAPTDFSATKSTQELCLTPTGEVGICSVMSKCPDLFESVETPVELEKYICEHSNEYAARVCCPKLPGVTYSPTTNLTTTTKSQIEDARDFEELNREAHELTSGRFSLFSHLFGRFKRHSYPDSYDYRKPYESEKPYWNSEDYTEKNKDYYKSMNSDVYILRFTDYPENYKNTRKSSDECGVNKHKRYSQKITGGNDAALGDYPWMALLQYKGAKIINGCGGALVSSRFVLTAAHCVDQRTLRARNLELYRIILGEYDIGENPDCVNYSKKTCVDPIRTYKASKIIKHEQFDNVVAMHDIALIQLNEEVTFTDSIRPICLPDTSVDETNKLVTTAGWGKTNTNGNYSTILQKAMLPVVDQRHCNVRGVNLIEGQMCLGLGDGVDTCTGDSGGPIFMQRIENMEEVTYQIGIISYGFATDDCGKAPSVNTDVSYYIDWIQRKIRKDS